MTKTTSTFFPVIILQQGVFRFQRECSPIEYSDNRRHSELLCIKRWSAERDEFALGIYTGWK